MPACAVSCPCCVADPLYSAASKSEAQRRELRKLSLSAANGRDEGELEKATRRGMHVHSGDEDGVAAADAAYDAAAEVPVPRRAERRALAREAKQKRWVQGLAGAAGAAAVVEAAGGGRADRKQARMSEAQLMKATRRGMKAEAEKAASAEEEAREAARQAAKLAERELLLGLFARKAQEASTRAQESADRKRLDIKLRTLRMHDERRQAAEAAEEEARPTEPEARAARLLRLEEELTEILMLYAPQKLGRVRPLLRAANESGGLVEAEALLRRVRAKYSLKSARNEVRFDKHL